MKLYCLCVEKYSFVIEVFAAEKAIGKGLV